MPDDVKECPKCQGTATRTSSAYPCEQYSCPCGHSFYEDRRTGTLHAGTIPADKIETDETPLRKPRTTNRCNACPHDYHGDRTGVGAHTMGPACPDESCKCQGARYDERKGTGRRTGGPAAVMTFGQFIARRFLKGE